MSSIPDSIIRYGIVGVGMMGMEHINNILCLEGTKITCIADNYEESIEKCIQFFKEKNDLMNGIKAFSSCEEFFKANLCDIAIIATPNHTHHDVLMKGYQYANANMHILVEKPMCTSIEDCRNVIKESSRREGKTFVGLEYSYMPPIKRVIEDVQKEKKIGTVHMVSIREYRFPFLIKIRNWNRFNCNSGGTFVEKCCHFFDLFNRILYPSIPKSIYASGGQNVNHLNEIYNGEKSDILDNGYVIINYSNNKRACLDLCMFAEASHSQEEVCIVGSKGKLEAFLPQLQVRTGIRNQHECGKVDVELVDDKRIKYKGHHYGSSYLEHLDIQQQIRNFKQGEKDENIGTAGLYHGLLSVAMGVAAHLSIDEDRAVRLTELLTANELQACISGMA